MVHEIRYAALSRGSAPARYISISGNTRSFVQRLTTYSEEQHQHNEKNPTITFKEISENSPLEVETEPFFTFVPTYLDGGDGINNVKKIQDQ